MPLRQIHSRRWPEDARRVDGGAHASISSTGARAPVSAVNASPMPDAPGCGDDLGAGGVAAQLALVQHDDVILGRISSTRCVVHNTPTPSSRASSRTIVENVGARLDVEPRRRLVEQHELGLMQQRAGDLDAPHLPAGEMARLVARAVGEADALQQDLLPRAAARRASCLAARRDRRGSARPRDRGRACAAETPRRAAPAPRRSRARRHGRRCGPCPRRGA